MEQLLTLREAADILGVSPTALVTAIRRGSLTAKMVGRDWVVTEDEVARYDEARKVPARHPSRKVWRYWTMPNITNPRPSMLLRSGKISYMDDIERWYPGRGWDMISGNLWWKLSGVGGDTDMPDEISTPTTCPASWLCCSASRARRNATWPPPWARRRCRCCCGRRTC